MSDQKSADTSTEGALNIHKIECPECSHPFYVGLPESPDDETVVEETECVECDSIIERTYVFDYGPSGKKTIEVSIEVKND